MRHTPFTQIVICLAAISLLASCTPQFYPGGDRTTQPVLQEQGLATADSTILPLRIWPARKKPAAAVVLALHGFNDYSKAFESPASWWADHGLTVYAYDQRGFGKAPHTGMWSGAETMAADLDDAVRAIVTIHPDTPVYLLGSSMGGAVILRALARQPDIRPKLIDGVILVGPAVWGPKTMNPVYRTTLWLGAHIFPSNQVSGRGLKIKPSDNIPMLRKLGRDPLIIKSTRLDILYGLVQLMGEALEGASTLAQPALVLGAANDQLVPGHAHQELLAALQNERTVATYPDGYHMLLRDLQAEVVWRDILSWIGDQDRPLPSGQGHKINTREATVR